jgi:GT2 family glycosyltransferase
VRRVTHHGIDVDEHGVIGTESRLAGPRTTVVMATSDRRRQVLASLAHLSRLPDAPPIILVDNGSRDGTAGAVRRAFPAVDVVRLSENRGAPARTVGVERASTPYVAFSDDDSWWAPGALDRAADVFEANHRLGLVAARVVVGPDERPDPVCSAMATSPLPADGLPGPQVLGFLACGSIVRRHAYLEAGGFDHVIFFFGEETLLAVDLARAGWQAAYVHGVVAHHHPAGPRDGRGRRRLQARNRLLTTWMCRPPGVALRSTAAMAVAARRDQDLRNGLVDAARAFPAAMARRRAVHPEVERALGLLDAADRGSRADG